MISIHQSSGPTDCRLLPSYGGPIARLIYEGSECTRLIQEYRIGMKTVKGSFMLQDMPN